MHPDLLAKVGLFAYLSADDLRDLARHLRARTFARNQFVFMEGDPGNGLWIVQSGRVKLSLSSSAGRELILDLLEPGDVFGELALLDGRSRSADAVAVERSELVVLSRLDFDCFVRNRPDVAFCLFRILATRLRRDASLLQDATFLEVPGRIARALLKLTQQQQSRSEEAPVTPRLSQTDMAAVAGTTRETLNKWLGIYEDNHIIRRDRGRITILNPDALREQIASHALDREV
jgi:CRP/FNR family transcriptional regulator, cyclic AMP receptor protein